MQIVYIAGPITGIENYEENFKKRENELLRMGFKVINPVEKGRILEKSLGRQPKHEEYMQFLIPYVLNANSISLLNGWQQSKGAKIEYDVAMATGKTIIDVKVF